MSQSGRGALILAVETGFLHGVDSLLLRGADLNEADPVRNQQADFPRQCLSSSAPF
eukprot:m.179404 g.179404  ORF g.179404 m.179404 type:complete len:56 (+) comp53422_c0_seq6:285-452(+)